MAKLLYNYKQEIKGKIISQSGNIVEVQLHDGGTMFLSKSEVQVVPDKAERKQAKKQYKKEHATEESEG